MKNLYIQAALVLVFSTAALIGSILWKPSQQLAASRPRVDLEIMFPKQFEGWVSDERMPAQLVSPDTQAMLNKLYNQALSRTYINSLGERVMLSVAYGGDQSDATRAHRPEVCYPAQGFQVLSTASDKLSLPSHNLPVRKLVAQQGERNEPITYWITVGDKTTVTGTEQKIAQLTYSLRGIIPDGMLVRVSSIGRDEKKAFEIQQRFILNLASAVTPQLRPQIFGNAGT